MPLTPSPTSTWSGSGASVFSGVRPSTVTQPERWIFTLGDSKTAFHDEQYGHWQDALIVSLAAASRGPWTYTNRGVGSQTVASYLAMLAGKVADTTPPTGSIPAAVLFNIGINDAFLGQMTSQATWQANWLSMIDIVRARYANAPIYVMRWWARNLDADANTMNGWVPAMIALRPNVFLGPDERVWMKGGDDGVTMTYDGIHQNTAGMQETAAQWQAVLWP